MYKWLVPCVIVTALAVSGCARTFVGAEQEIALLTPHVTGASCRLFHMGETWAYVPSTPTVIPGPKHGTYFDGALYVTCGKEGYRTTTVKVLPPYEMALTLLSAGTFGIPGLFVDSATGATARYPDEIVIWLPPVEWASAEEEASWLLEQEEPKTSVALQEARNMAYEESNPATEKTTAEVLTDLKRLIPDIEIAVHVAPVLQEPRPLAAVVKEVRVGQLVQIVEVLPTGWVLAAEAGKPIGYIHWTAFPIPRQAVRHGNGPPQWTAKTQGAFIIN